MTHALFVDNHIRLVGSRTPEWHSVREKKAAREGAASSMCQGRGRDRPRRGCRHGARAKTEALRGDATPFSMSLSAPLGPATRAYKGLRGLAMSLSANLISRSPAFLSPLKDRELDLRGNKIAVIENLAATQDQFDSIDLSCL